MQAVPATMETSGRRNSSGATGRPSTPDAVETKVCMQPIETRCGVSA